MEGRGLSQQGAWLQRLGGALDAPSAGAGKANSSSGTGNLLEVLEINDDDDTGVLVVDISCCGGLT